MNPDILSTQHVFDDNLRLYVLGSLNATQVGVLERHMLECNDCRKRLSASARTAIACSPVNRDGKDPDRRSEPRFSTSEIGSLRSFSPYLPERWRARITDVSKNGLGLLLPVHLRPGVLVQIRIGTIFALGEVRYSKPVSQHEFRTGVRLSGVFPSKNGADT